MLETDLKFRATRQRQVILEELRGVTSHPTADEVYDMVRRRMPHISLGTVYRNLEALSEQGLIQKLEFGGHQMRFDGNPQNHCHVRCTQCSCISDLDCGQIDEIDVIITNLVTDYDIDGYRLEFTGLCPRCKKADN